jgi:hypothetical protein
MSEPENDEHNDPIVMTRHQLMVSTLMVEGGILVIAILLGWWRDVPFWQDVHYIPFHILLGIGFGVPLLGCIFVLLKLPWKVLDQMHKDFELVVTLFKNATVFDLLLVSIMAGICEEALFRGFFQLWIGQSLSPPVTIFIVAILFGLAHCISKIYVVLTLIISLFLSIQLHYFDNLLVPILTHAAYDFFALVYGTRGGAGKIRAE